MLVRADTFIVSREMEGEQLRFRLSDMIIGRQLFEQIYLRREYQTQPGFEVRRGDVVIDIGGNVGLFTILAATQVGEEGRVYVFEPSHNNFQRLQEHLVLNQIQNVICYNVGVADTCRQGILFEPLDEGAYSLFKDNALLFSNGENLEERTEVVSLVALKDIFDENNITTCNYLKIDCEGAEELILKALPREYYSRIQKLVLEWHANINIDKLQGLIEDMGFECWRHHQLPEVGIGMLFAFNKSWKN